MQRGGSAYGLDKELATKAMAKYDTNAEAEARDWIEAITGKAIGPDFGLGLKDGVILCELANAVDPASRIKISTSTMPFKQMENVTAFIRACRGMGVMEFDLFETVDLFEQKDLGVVVRCLHALGRTLQKKGTYNGPLLGVKESTRNERTFTEAQLAEARHATSLLNMGSQAIMERPNIDVTTGVTFGADSTSDLPPVSSGYSSPPSSSTIATIPTILTKNAQGAFSSPDKPLQRTPSANNGSPTKASSSVAARWMSAAQSNNATPTPSVTPPKQAAPAPVQRTPSAQSVTPPKQAAPAPVQRTPSAQSVTPPKQAAPVQVWGGGHGLDAELASKAVAKYDHALEADVKQWIEAVTHRTLTEFGPSLQNGQVLCVLINTLYAISMADETPIQIDTSSVAFKQMQNIEHFLDACRAIGVAAVDVFETVDLFELKDLGAVVRCLLALNRAVVKKFPAYPGPVLTAAVAPSTPVKQVETPVAATPVSSWTAPVASSWNTPIAKTPETPAVETKPAPGVNPMLRHSSSKGLPTRTNWQ
ncbi:hypothetical protein SPRG_12755 [Saprolegnia parasitica CBS 223.65]|uniref:Calponin-homology (CH) domain-containing protein n=1 Tax=Saprolegnia parasitica (strain CBS 223.65) TaxID=695850 RepID=A0A067C6M9_SAPPC|nr:hypothetical protein SPRG_12755 [Saprolegnia parasitica CBS 223.65]KDO22472.1 hypothetical protein SPRG_12755 [Saprolegnia parasitica CBS 223.65]|eukprot:XP_012206859.1 hypothetical protein SPRG_12755 [Saprolegnia parasitica CBS 223.65]